MGDGGGGGNVKKTGFENVGQNVVKKKSISKQINNKPEVGVC